MSGTTRGSVVPHDGEMPLQVVLAVATCLLFFVSPKSVESKVCREELEFALDGDRPVLSVHLEPTPLPDGIKLAIANRQALFRQELEPEDYERKLLSAVATYLDQPLPSIETSLRTPVRKSSRQISMILAVGCSLLVGGIAVVGTWMATRPNPPEPKHVVRFPLDLPAGVTLNTTNVWNPFDISSNGQRIVFNGIGNDGINRLYVRFLNEVVATPIRGAEGELGSVHLSPDGEWVAFSDRADGAIKKVRVSGGSPVTIAEYGWGTFGKSWESNDTIIFAPRTYAGLMEVSESGGMPKKLTEPPDPERHGQPHILADGSAVLFSAASSPGASAAYRIAVLSLLDGKQRILTEGSYPQVTSSGHLLFLREGSILAMVFDADRLEVSGVAVPVLEDVATLGVFPRFSVAGDGSMVYLPKSAASSGDTLVWLDLDGHETALTAPPKSYSLPRVSPDGRHVAVTIASEDSSTEAVWLYSIERGTLTPLTPKDDTSIHPIWSPNKKIIYSSFRDGVVNLDWRNANGTGVEERLTTSSNNQYAFSWSFDEQQVLYQECSPTTTTCDLGRMTPPDESTAELFLATDANERYPVLSPDGHWLAYVSNFSGTDQIYVRPYPETESFREPISH